MSEQTEDWAARLDVMRHELAALSEEVRRLIGVTVSVDAPVEALVNAREQVARVATELARYVPTPRPPRYAGSSSSDVADFFPFDPIVGRLSPIAPPLRVEWQDPRALGHVRFGVPYEGPPGCVHGGIIAASFDQVFNVANLMRGVAGPTRRLEVRYLRPTPLEVDLVFEGWVERVEGREVHTVGRILNGDEVTVEAEGVFIQVSYERVMRLLDPGQAKPAEPPEARDAVPEPTEPAPAAETAAARRRRFRSSGDGS